MSKPSSNKKSVARLVAVQALFAIEATRRQYQLVLSEFQSRDIGELLGEGFEGAFDRDLLDDIVKEAVLNQARIDQAISPSLKPDWPIAKIDPTLRAIFRAAGAELLLAKAPYKVVVNEYLEVLKAFDDDKATVRFANAVIDATGKHLLDVDRA